MGESMDIGAHVAAIVTGRVSLDITIRVHDSRNPLFLPRVVVRRFRSLRRHRHELILFAGKRILLALSGFVQAASERTEIGLLPD